MLLALFLILILSTPFFIAAINLHFQEKKKKREKFRRAMYIDKLGYFAFHNALKLLCKVDSEIFDVFATNEILFARRGVGMDIVIRLDTLCHQKVYVVDVRDTVTKNEYCFLMTAGQIKRLIKRIEQGKFKGHSEGRQCKKE